ncbi:MAG: hypothetical protein ACI4ND_07145 [Succinivibrio sp.]
MELSSNNRFTKCIEFLLQGKIICSVLCPDLYRYILEPNEPGEISNEERIQLFLGNINRKLVHTSDDNGFYCVVLDKGSLQAKNTARAKLKEAAYQLEPFVKWMRIVRSCSRDIRPIEANDIIKPSELIASLEESEFPRNQLKEVANSLCSGNQANMTDIKRILQSVLKQLVKDEYLVDVNDGLIYKATAKWTRLYEYMEFIAENEGFGQESLDNNPGYQTDLFAANGNTVLDPSDESNPL